MLAAARCLNKMNMTKKLVPMKLPGIGSYMKYSIFERCNNLRTDVFSFATCPPTARDLPNGICAGSIQSKDSSKGQCDGRIGSRSPSKSPCGARTGGGRSDGCSVGRFSKPRKLEMKIIPASLSITLSYDERNVRKGRNLSPYLSIYRPQITSVMSILIRVTGIMMTVIVWSYAMFGLFKKENVEYYVDKIKEWKLSSLAVHTLKFFIAFPFAYHTVAGMRHLIWYTGMFLTKPTIYMTGYIAIILTIALAAFLVLLDLKDTPSTEGDKRLENVKLIKEIFDSMDVIEITSELDEECKRRKEISDLEAAEIDANTYEGENKEK